MTGAWTEITNEEDPPMIALIDYDAGNIKSVEKAFQSLGKEVVLTRDPDVLKTRRSRRSAGCRQLWRCDGKSEPLSSGAGYS